MKYIDNAAILPILFVLIISVPLIAFLIMTEPPDIVCEKKCVDKEYKYIGLLGKGDHICVCSDNNDNVKHIRR
jgi:hypothetical protein